MKLLDHRHGDLEIPDTILLDGAENLAKLRLNVLSHVLGFRYRRTWWRNEGWHMLFDVLQSQRDAAEQALAATWALPDERGVIPNEDLRSALSNSADVRAITDQLVPFYRSVIASAVRAWIVDYHWHHEGRYRLMDHQAVVLAGAEGGGTVKVRTCFRAARVTDWCGMRSAPERVRMGHQMQVESLRGGPIWHDRWGP